MGFIVVSQDLGHVYLVKSGSKHEQKVENLENTSQ